MAVDHRTEALCALDGAAADLLSRVYALSSLAQSYRHLVDQASNQRDESLSWVFVLSDHVDQLALAGERLDQATHRVKRVQGGNPGEQAQPRDCGGA